MRSTGGLAVVVFITLGTASPAQQKAAADVPERVDYLTFAQGAIPIRVGGAGAKLGVSFEEAIQATDGNPMGFALAQKLGAPDTDTEFTQRTGIFARTASSVTSPRVLCVASVPEPRSTIPLSGPSAEPYTSTCLVNVWDGLGVSRTLGTAKRSKVVSAGN